MAKNPRDVQVCDNCGREARVNTDYSSCPYCGFTYCQVLAEIEKEINSQLKKGLSHGTSKQF